MADETFDAENPDTWPEHLIGHPRIDMAYLLHEPGDPAWRAFLLAAPGLLEPHWDSFKSGYTAGWIQRGSV